MASPTKPSSWLSRIGTWLKRKGVPAPGTEYVVGLNTRDTQFMRPNQPLTIRLPHDPGSAFRWAWDRTTYFELIPTARQTLETDPSGQAFDVWHFVTQEPGTAFVRFFHVDVANPEAPPATTFIVTVQVNRV